MTTISYYRTHRAWMKSETGALAIGTISADLLAKAEALAEDCRLEEHSAAAGFCDACRSDNTIRDLVEALEGKADQTDCEAWGIDAHEWRDAIKTALHHMIDHIREYAIAEDAP